MPQVRLELDDELYQGLKAYADEEIRDLSGQALWIVRTALRERMKYAAAARDMEARGPLLVPSIFSSVPPVPVSEPVRVLPPAEGEPF